MVNTGYRLRLQCSFVCQSDKYNNTVCIYTYIVGVHTYPPATIYIIISFEVQEADGGVSAADLSSV